MKYLLALCLLIGCVPHARTPSTELTTVRILFCGDPSFSDDERLQVEKATDNWRARSGGHVDFRIVWGCTDSPRVLRRKPEDNETLRQEAEQAKIYNNPGLHLYGWQNDHPTTVSLVVSDANLRQLAEHEFGHAAGLRWSGCKGTSRECNHTREEGHLMSPHWAGTDFDEVDLEFCRASRLCL